jgi:mannose-6-phosphate isomerase-like protein (cupin superfamily)
MSSDGHICAEALTSTLLSHGDGEWPATPFTTSIDPVPTGLLSLADIDVLLSGSAVRVPAVRVVRSGSIVPPSEFTYGASAGREAAPIVRPDRIHELLSGGATLILQELQWFVRPLGSFASALEDAVGVRVFVNAFLTPPDAKGFPPHDDPYSSFLVQLHGSKAWVVGDGEAESQTTLEPGDVLWIPRGVTHHAHTVGAQPSLHLTVAFTPPTVAAAMHAMIDAHLGAAADELVPPLPAKAARDDLAARVREQLALLAKRPMDLPASFGRGNRLAPTVPALPWRDDHRGGDDDGSGPDGIGDSTSAPDSSVD